jgi:hypothetical protein
MFDLINHGETEDPVSQTLVSDFRMTCENEHGPSCSSSSREAFLQNYLQLLESNPGFYFNVEESSVKLSDSNRKATMILSGDKGVQAQPTSMRLGFVNSFSWEWRKSEGWVCCRGKCIRCLAGDIMGDVGG